MENQVRTVSEIGEYKDIKEYCNKNMVFPIKGEVIRNKKWFIPRIVEQKGI